MSECTASKPVSLESACPKTNMCGVSSYFEHFSWSKWSLFLSIAFPIWKPYFSLTIQKQSCFWPGRTAQNHLKVVHLAFWMCLSQWWWSEVCLTSSLLDKVCISLYNGNFAKKKPDLESPSYPHLLFLLPSQMMFDPYPNKTKSILDLHIRKKSIWWRNMEHFAAIFFRYSLLSNVA